MQQATTKTSGIQQRCDERGFTLVEMLMAMLVSTVIMGAMYCAFHAQHRTQNAQEQVADMELNARVGMTALAAEFRMAGFNPEGKITKKILVAKPGEFQFVTTNDQTWAEETITYRLPETVDQDGDGVVDAGWSDWLEDRPALGRRVGGGTPQPLARGVEAVEFVYLVGDAMKPTLRPEADKLDDIRAVTVTLMMRGVDEDRTISPRSPEDLEPGSVHLHGMRKADNPAWQNFSGAQLRRRVHYSTVQLRNLNLIKP